MTLIPNYPVACCIHDRLVGEGARLIDTSASGSRYYRRPGGGLVRVADHAPNEATQAYLNTHAAYMAHGYESVRLDILIDGEPSVERVKPATTGEHLKLPSVERATPQPPEPGIYRNVPAEQYHRWPGASNSRMTDMMRSPAHCREKMVNPTEPTPAMRIGTAIHYAVLQPELFDGVYVIAEQCCATKKSNERCTNTGTVRINGDWYCGVHGKDKGAPDAGFEVLSQDELDQCHRCRDAVWAHPAAEKILDAVPMDDRELSIVWDDPETQTRCKLRADGVARSLGVCMDVKSTNDAGTAAFTRSIFNFGYHRQGAHALHGLAALGLPLEHFVIIAVEKDPPHGVAVYRLEDDAIEAGRKQMLPHIERYGVCERTGLWPAYDDGVQDITLPPWAWKQIDAEL